jgi:hypothetical protein
LSRLFDGHFCFVSLPGLTEQKRKNKNESEHSERTMFALTPPLLGITESNPFFMPFYTYILISELNNRRYFGSCEDLKKG